MVYKVRARKFGSALKVLDGMQEALVGSSCQKHACSLLMMPYTDISTLGLPKTWRVGNASKIEAADLRRVAINRRKKAARFPSTLGLPKSWRVGSAKMKENPQRCQKCD